MLKIIGISEHLRNFILSRVNVFELVFTDGINFVNAKFVLSASALYSYPRTLLYALGYLSFMSTTSTDFEDVPVHASTVFLHYLYFVHPCILGLY